MFQLTKFLKQNKQQREHVFFPATKSLLDEDGQPVLWELRAVTAKENESIQESCITEIPVPGSRSQFRQKLNSGLYVKKLLAASVVVPDLLDADLQDSYGVKKPEDLVQEMVDGAGEWNAFLQFVNRLNGFTTVAEDVEQAKN